MPDLKELVCARGYLKAGLTRLHNFVATEVFQNSSVALLEGKRSKLVETYKQYEIKNVEILVLNQNDTEDVSEAEEFYFSTLAKIDEALRKTTPQTSTPTANPPMARTKLPSIEIPPFTGKYSDFLQFMNIFHSVIHNNSSLDNVQKLYYLRNFLKNEPLDLIKNLPISEESYSEAIEIIKDRYENSGLIVNDHVMQLLDINPIKSSAQSLRSFVSNVKQNIAAIRNLDSTVDTWDPLLICILSRKLDSYTLKAYQMDRDVKQKPKVKDFLEFLERRALAQENVDANGQQTPNNYRSKMPTAAVNITTKQDNPDRLPSSCKYCTKSSHRLYNCPKFKLIPVAERVTYIKENKLCNRCLNFHSGKCRFHFRCNTCKRNSHHTLLHTEESESPVVLLTNNMCNNQTLLPTANIRLVSPDGKVLHIKALLDTGSQVSFVTTKVIKRLGIQPKETNMNVIGITKVNNKIKYSVPLEVHSLAQLFKLTVNCNVVEQITCKLPQQKFEQFEIPSRIQLADVNYNNPSEIDMLMGCDVFFQVLLPTQPLQLLKSDGQTATTSAAAPCLINTRFGYVVGGAIPALTTHLSNQVTLLCNTCNSDIKDTLQQFWKTEEVPQIFCEKSSETEQCEEIFKSTVKSKNNQFQVDLPLKVPLEQVNDYLGDSFNLALNRFLNLEKKLHKNETLFQQYKKFIDEIIELGHGHYVDIQDYDFQNDPIYFLPHHAVLNEKSVTTKLRAVFDGSMKTNKKISLNDILLNGPIVQRDLFEILMLFRFGEHMFTTDLKKMFRCVKLNPSHSSLQNILWRESPSTEIKCIRLDTVTYGLKSSSFLATRCLDELSTRFKEELPLASAILQNSTYVDDILHAENDVNKLIEAKAQLIKILSKGGFQAHKWSSNVPEILDNIPKKELHFDNIDLENNDLHMKTLGIQFNVKDDNFIISCPEPFGQKKVTKREVLSYISKFYDPPGFITPIIITAKSFIQKTWSAGIDWDSPLTDDLQHEWLLFVQTLANMLPISLRRNIPTANAVAIQLIGFADAASSLAYGCCVYLRVIYDTGVTCMYLLCSKSRVNPLNKTLTIPRLELNAALLLSKLITKVQNCITNKIAVHNTYLFSDSKIVLAWIESQQTQLQAYVANRVKVITQLTMGYTWHYAPSQENPADCITRGVSPEDLAHNDMWWNGPTFLRNSEYKFDKVELPTVLPEQKTAQAAVIEVPAETSLSCSTADANNRGSSDLFERYSDINKMTRVIAYIMRFYNNCKDRSKRIQCKFLTCKELESALILIVKSEQNAHFSKEIALLKNDQNVSDPLQSLHPFLDDNDVLRVGGRLHNSELSYKQKHPVILPKLSRITDMIIRNEHLRLLHAGPKLLLSNLNSKFWLINGLRHVKKVIHKCITCFKLKAEASKQLMGSLPTQRVTQASPFVRVGLDFAGPINVKQSRIRRSVISKGYICVFVCFTTKAIHLELASDLTTPTFIACFKRFISRRNLPHDIFCDNGSTFVGARNQLADLYRVLRSQEHQTQVNNYSLQHNINFHFIPKYSPVFGGLWEAAVKSTKYHMKRVLGTNILTYEELNTVLSQIEAVLNSRPLLPLSSNCEDFAYLTPGHFLTGRPLLSCPQHDLSEVPITKLRLWNVTNKMVQSFWKSWHKHYLNVLQSRPKWKTDYPNVKVGDLVLLRENNTPPLTWPMARITKVFPGADNKVRAFEVMTSNRKAHVRSITKICLFPINDIDN